jgi:Domain of unknown function (DUF4129)
MSRIVAGARVAGLGAAAEACVVALPLATVLLRSPSEAAVATFAAVWICLSGLAAVGAVRMRSDEGARVWLVIAAVSAGVLLGRGALGTSVAVTVLLLPVGLRLFARSTREDPEPTAAELWIWTMILGAEAALASIVHDSTWTSAATVLTPAALSLGLAARAADLSAVDADQGVSASHQEGARLGGRLALAPIAGALVALAVAGSGGPLDRLGSVAGGALRWLATLMVLVGSLVIFPIAWGWELIVGRTSDLQGFLDRARRQRTAALAHPAAAGASPLVARLIGVAILVGLVWLGLAVVRRVRTRQQRSAPARSLARVTENAPPTIPPEAEEPRMRRGLPRDRVRRRYAEMLLVFARAGLGKDPGQTPAEYLAVVGATYPASRVDFETVTRAYETVRYAERLPDDVSVRAIDAAARRVRRSVRRDQAPSD